MCADPAHSSTPRDQGDHNSLAVDSASGVINKRGSMETIKLKKTEILVLRNVQSDMTSYNGFKWPESGEVEAKDWEDTDQCGNGLHGLPWGVGSVGYFYGSNDCKWLLVKVDTSKGYQHGIGDMTDKCKFRCGEVVFCGSREDAIAILQKYAPLDSIINYTSQKAGSWSTQKAGDESTQTAGPWSTQKASINSVQIIHWLDDEWKVSTRVVSEKEADKWYYFENGDWRLCTDEEARAADERVSK